MADNFYIGTIIHKNIFNKVKTKEKIVLYSADRLLFINLINQKEYSTNDKKRNYIDLNSIIKIDIDNFKIDYMHLLYRYIDSKKGKLSRRKQKIN